MVRELKRNGRGIISIFGSSVFAIFRRNCAWKRKKKGDSIKRSLAMKRAVICFFLAIIMTMSSFADVRIGDQCADSRCPLIASDGNNHVYAIWQKTSGNITYLLFNYSADKGKTWLAQNISLGQVDNENGNAYAISTDKAGNAYILRLKSGNVYVTVFSNYGSVWQNWKLESVAGETFQGSTIKFASDDHGHLYTVLYSSTYWDHFLYTSGDFGKSWTRRALPAGFPQGQGIFCDSVGTVYVLGLKSEQNADGDSVSILCLSRSSDRGMSWKVFGKKIVSYTGDEIKYGTSFYCDASGLVHVAWVDARDGKGDIYMSCSRDYGLTWYIREKRVNTDTEEEYLRLNPQIAADSMGHVYVVWIYNASINPDIAPIEHVYLNYSWDYGATWLSSDMKMSRWVQTSTYERSYIKNHKVTCDSTGQVNVVWLELAYPENCVKRQNSANYGQSWLPSINQINAYDSLTEPYSYSPFGATAGPPGEAYFIWMQGDDASEVVFSKCRAVQPPANIQVQYGYNRTLFKKEHYDTVTWEDHPLNAGMDIEAYVVCWRYESEGADIYHIEGALVKTVTADVHSYAFLYPITEEKRVYALYSVDNWGVYSPVSAWNSGQ